MTQTETYDIEIYYATSRQDGSVGERLTITNYPEERARQLLSTIEAGQMLHVSDLPSPGSTMHIPAHAIVSR